MIDFNCPKCGELLSVPDSLTGKVETCPTCGNVCVVPQTPDVQRAARFYGHTATGLRTGRSFVRRHKKLLIFVGVNLVLLTGAMSWLLPGWVPRPVLTIENPSIQKGGLFPARSKMVKLLEKYKYYPIFTEPQPDVLRGRRLLAWRYARDVTKPDATSVNLWSPLDDRDRIIAISAKIAMPAKPKGQQELETAVAALGHNHHLGELIHEIARIRPTQTEFAYAETLYDGQVTREHYEITSGGFELERIIVVAKGADLKPETFANCIILKDRTWQ